MNYEQAVFIVVGDEFNVQIHNMQGRVALHVVLSYGVVSTPLDICPQPEAAHNDKGVPVRPHVSNV
jgi:hypothetical protein